MSESDQLSSASAQTERVLSDVASITAPVASKDVLEAVFNTSTLGIHVLQSQRDDSGQIVDFDIVLTNVMSEKIAGKKVMGKKMLEEWPHTRTIGLFQKFIDTVETGQPLDYEQLYVGDGVRSWFRWIASKFNDGLYVTIEDITHRKKAEEAVVQTADRLRSTLDGVPAFIALLEAKKNIDTGSVDFVVSVANAALANFSRCSVEELQGQKMEHLYPEAFQGKLKENYLKVYETGAPLNVEIQYPGLDRWFSILVTRQVDGSGLVTVGLDITEKKKVEDEHRKVLILTSMDKIKTEFFSNVSHEFRTPLTLILGPLQDVLNSKSIPRIQLNKLDMVQRNALRLQKLVNSLLDFSRIEAGRFDAVFQPTDICAFTKQLAGSFSQVIESSGLKLIVDCQPVEPVYVNRDMWEKIVFNLLSNAFKFTFTGKIEITIKSSAKHVQLQVVDSGIGIAKENLSKIFDRFVRIENVKSRTYEGSGIGLALVKEFVAIHGGSIKVTSKENKGSKFSVYIPKGKKHLPSRMIHEFNDTSLHSRHTEVFKDEVMGWSGEQKFINGRELKSNDKPLILLVDDNADMREYIKEILKPDFNVVEAANGKIALKILMTGSVPDLILADIMMPEINGYELLTTLRQQEKTALIPFIFVSAKASPENRNEGISYGASDYLVKPFSSTQLLGLIEARLRSVPQQPDNHKMLA